MDDSASRQNADQRTDKTEAESRSSGLGDNNYENGVTMQSRSAHSSVSPLLV